jgi:hypothetical protein
MDHVMTIGLGKFKTIDSLRVIWPDDKTVKLENVVANQFLTIKHSDAEEVYTPIIKEKKSTLLKEIPYNQLIAHKENVYSDFDYEGLIYKQLSQEGPALAVGDINGDGNEDVFIGGAKNESGIVYQHSGNGMLKVTNQNSLEKDAEYEDTAAAFFDADGDSDLDLIVGSGGNQVGEETNYRARLYLNNGKGTFVKSSEKLPSTFTNISIIAPLDYDNDGDTDLFIGSRSVVGTYGIDPDHLLLENKGDGTFENVTERNAYDLKDAGMITDAVWADMDGDSKKDLILVEDWGTPKIFKNTVRRLSRKASVLDSLHGWWNVVEAVDIDKDGDNDLILGNQGANLHYRPAMDRPMKMWVNDFDENGTIEQIVTQNIDGKDYPHHQKKDLTTQMVALKKQNLKASEYSKKTISELFPVQIIENSIMKKSVISESIIAVNEGDGNFTVIKLPSRSQLSCICGITCADVNSDGNLDLIMGGNDFEFKPQYSRLDANYGNVLLGDGALGFEWQDYDTSGFFIRDEIKHLKQFKDKTGKTFIIVAINEKKPKIFELNE